MFARAKLKDQFMKKVRLTLALASLFIASAARADVLDNIQTWVGTGVNEAAFEIDWNNGTTDDALIWGYRWNGSATGEQMFDAIVAADPRLYAAVSEPGEWGSFGTAIYGLGFHPSGDQNFQLSASASPALSFNSQHLAYLPYTDADYTRTAATPGDLWQEGYDNTGYPGDPNDGYWAYFNSTDSRLSLDSADWDFASAGMTTRTLENGDVDGWDFSFNGGQGDFAPAAPLDVAPAPEPSTWAILFLGGISLFGLHRNRHAQKVA
jgi:hypothetical protein